MQESNFSAPIAKGWLNRTVIDVVWVVNFSQDRNCIRRRVHAGRYAHDSEDV